MRALVVILATGGGAGYVPVAPGTAGSLVAVPLIPLLGLVHARGGPGLWAAAVAALIAIAIWAAGRAEPLFGHDAGKIVIDEIAGMIVASCFVPATWTAAAVVFVFFRLFDVWKPFPAGVVDRSWPGGLGVVGDDLVAGVYAGLVARLLLEVLP
ncbi:MAG: phosphatidylglycerophosphatase A [bacterium]|nr:phosphatidylglycerophosphatase A [bacterium]